jgi:dihydroorotate dehydrogenase (NAD+) catalytic subunit
MNILNQFGPVWDAAGLRGFFGEGYWFHRLVPFWLSFEGSTLVTKTVTSQLRKGNMPLNDDWTPQDRFPLCIHTDWLRGNTLNSVGLSGPGVETLIDSGGWVSIQRPYMISWMPVETELDKKLIEAHHFVREIGQIMPFMLTPHLGIQFNVSCPNVGADHGELLEEADLILTILGTLRLPIVVKLNLLMSAGAADKLAHHPDCAGICIANTLPFGKVLSEEWWDRHYPGGSPLERRSMSFGKGGLSGPVLLPLVCDWVHRFRRINQETHVNAGGGVWHVSDVDSLKAVGADSIFIGTVAMHRPWRVPGIIRRAHELFGN